LGKLIDLKSVRKDSPEAPLTLEQGLRLLGLKEWPEEWELWKLQLFVDGLASIIKREGEAWVRFNRGSILEELEHFMTTTKKWTNDMRNEKASPTLSCNEALVLRSERIILTQYPVP